MRQLEKLPIIFPGAIVMNRRGVLQGAAAGGVFLLSGGLNCGRSGKEEQSARHNSDRATELAGFGLHELREQYRNYLFDDYLPFMEKYVIDHEYGGFMCNTDRDGTNITGNKNTWYMGRGIWVYSFLYNQFGREEKYLDVAKTAADFILKHEPEGDGLYPAAFTREGKPVKTGNLIEVWKPPEWDMYGDLFVAEGLSEFAKATGNRLYRDKAVEILQKCIRLYDSPDYPYEVTYGPDVPRQRGLRILGHWMVFLRMTTQMLRIQQDPELEKIAARSVDAIMNYHYNPRYDLINEVLTHEMKIPDNAFSRFVYSGHAIETMWMVMDEAVRLNNKKLFESAAKRFKRHVEVAWDDVYGGVYRGIDDVDENTWKLDKVLWAQEEVLVGALLALEHSGWDWTTQIFSEMYTYIIAKYPLNQFGYSLWMNTGDRQMTFTEHDTRVENYHHPRHLMLNLLALDRIIARNGAPSGVFNS